MSLTAVSGLLNIATMLSFVRNSKISEADIFFISLSITSFFVILLSSPINTGKIKYLLSLKNKDSDFIRALSLKMLLKMVTYLPYAFFVIFLVSYFAISLSDISHDYNDFVLAFSISLYVCSCIIFEQVRIENQIAKSFVIFPSANAMLNIIVLFGVTFFKFGLLEFLYTSLVIRMLISILYFVRTVDNVKNECLDAFNSIDSKFHVGEFFNVVRVYSGAVFITALSSFLPSFLLSFFGVGVITSYQLALRCITSPMALVITPYVDFIRYSLSHADVNIRKYTQHLLVILLFSSSLSLFLFLSSSIIESFFIKDSSFKGVFTYSIVILSFSLISGSVYIFNTRLAELKLSLSKMSIAGLLVHCTYLFLISLATFLNDFDLFLWSKFFIDIIVFLPLSFWFIYSSKIVSFR
ncbi:hypothetical protein [Vibrio coralliirubri]|uniref:hypothetical protein n=1 Tax=Vibrio coralliirubri TaxID=1516159 RepID=UPI00067910D0|nr:hypothetical protein [Vibrio coralliirubri]